MALSKLFWLDSQHPGYITGSTLIINDTEKYDMGRPNSYDGSCMYFDVTKRDGKDFFDKYFTSGRGAQTIKMAWVFRT